MLALPDGGILVSDEDGRVIRYTEDGARDLTFAGDGVLETGLSAGMGRALAARFMGDASNPFMSGDGSFYVGGTTSGGDFGIGRFTEAGSPISTFGSSGLLSFDLGGADELEAIGFYWNVGNEGVVAVGHDGSGMAAARIASDGQVTEWSIAGPWAYSRATSVQPGQGRTAIVGVGGTSPASVSLAAAFVGESGAALTNVFDSGFLSSGEPTSSEETVAEGGLIDTYFVSFTTTDGNLAYLSINSESDSVSGPAVLTIAGNQRVRGGRFRSDFSDPFELIVVGPLAETPGILVGSFTLGLVASEVGRSGNGTTAHDATLDRFGRIVVLGDGFLLRMWP